MILKKELLLLEQINQWLGVLGNTYRMEAANLSNHRVLRTYAWLTWDDSRGNKNNLSRIHGGNLHRLHVNQRKSLLSSKHMFHERDMRIMLTQVSNTSLMFNMNHGEDKNVADGLNKSSGWPYKWMKVVTSSKFTCIWCKFPPWIWEILFLLPRESSQVGHVCAKYSMVWQTDHLHSICIP